MKCDICGAKAVENVNGIKVCGTCIFCIVQ